MGKARGIASAIAIALLTACAASRQSSTLEEADAALRKGQYERAWQLYEVELTARPGAPLVVEKAELARKRAAKARLDSARRAEKSGDLDGALEHLGWASTYAPGDREIVAETSRVREARRRVQARIREAEARLDAGEAGEALLILDPLSRYARTFPEIPGLTSRARGAAGREEAKRRMAKAKEHLAAGEPLAAFRGYRDALALDPELEGAAEGRERARAAAAARILEDAQAAAARGEPGAGLAALEAGKRELGEGDPDLVRWEASFRFEIRERLRTSAAAHAGAGRSASALVLLRAAAIVDPAFDRESVRVAEELLGRELGREVRIREFRDGTGGRVDTSRFTDHVLAAIEDFPPGPWIEFSSGEGEADLVVSGEVTSLEVEEAEPQVERRLHEHLLRVEKEPNPARPRLEAELRELGSRLADAESTWRAARDELSSLERLKGSARVRGDSGRRFGPYREAAYFRILGSARDREAKARRARDQLRARVEETRSRLEGTPYYTEKEIYGRSYYDAVTRTKNALATAELLEGGSVAANMTVRDTVVSGNPAVELPPDPDEMPSDVEVAGRVLDDLAARVAGSIGARAVELRRSLLDKARELAEAGDAEGALDRYAAFAISAGRGMELERANACGRIERRWGIDLSGETMSIEDLRY